MRYSPLHYHFKVLDGKMTYGYVDRTGRFRVTNSVGGVLQDKHVVYKAYGTEYKLKLPRLIVQEIENLHWKNSIWRIIDIICTMEHDGITFTETFERREPRAPYQPKPKPAPVAKPVITPEQEFLTLTRKQLAYYANQAVSARWRPLCIPKYELPTSPLEFILEVLRLADEREQARKATWLASNPPGLPREEYRQAKRQKRALTGK